MVGCQRSAAKIRARGRECGGRAIRQRRGLQGRHAAGIERLDAADHFQEGLLRQILAERFVQRGFAEKAGNVVIIQPDELVE